jgi:hypothetical protein
VREDSTAATGEARRRVRKILQLNTMALPPSVERRKFERIPLQLILQFTRAFSQGEVVDCITENISSEGVYFVSRHAVTTGERIEIDLLFHPHNTGRKQVNLHMRCLALVVRVESARHGIGFGIACRIEKYTILFGDSDLRRDRMFQSTKA